MEYTAEQWSRIGTAIKRARYQAGWRTLGAFHRVTGISTKTLGAVEAGTRVSEETLWRIESVLGWSEGTFDEIAAGGRTPNPVGTEHVAPVDTSLDNQDVIRYQRPPGLSDTEWDRLRHQSHAVVQALLEQAAAERDG